METVHNASEVLQERLRQKREREDQHRVWLDALLNEYDVARITGLSVASVRRWRLLRQGPKYLKIGAAVRYEPSSIREFLATRPTGGGTQPEARQ
jgi:predicted DNA-binding transcriptional regulator AlpA